MVKHKHWESDTSTSCDSVYDNEDIPEVFSNRNHNSEEVLNNTDVLITSENPVDEEIDFDGLYMQYVRDTEEERVQSSNE